MYTNNHKHMQTFVLITIHFPCLPLIISFPTSPTHIYLHTNKNTFSSHVILVKSERKSCSNPFSIISFLIFPLFDPVSFFVYLSFIQFMHNCFHLSLTLHLIPFLFYTKSQPKTESKL